MHAATGKRYSDYLDLERREIAAIARGSRQRNVLARTQGLVDAEYIARSHDTTCCEGDWSVERRAFTSVSRSKARSNGSRISGEFVNDEL